MNLYILLGLVISWTLPTIAAEYLVIHPSANLNEAAEYMRTHPDSRPISKYFMTQTQQEITVSTLNNLIKNYFEGGEPTDSTIEKLKSLRLEKSLNQSSALFLKETYLRLSATCKSTTCKEWIETDLKSLKEILEAHSSLPNPRPVQSFEGLQISIDGLVNTSDSVDLITNLKHPHFWTIYSNTAFPFTAWGKWPEVYSIFQSTALSLVQSTSRKDSCQTELASHFVPLEIETKLFISKNCEDQKIKSDQKKKNFNKYLSYGAGILFGIGIILNQTGYRFSF